MMVGFLKRGINLIFSKIKRGIILCFLHSVPKMNIFININN